MEFVTKPVSVRQAKRQTSQSQAICWFVVDHLECCSPFIMSSSQLTLQNEIYIFFKLPKITALFLYKRKLSALHHSRAFLRSVFRLVN